MKYPQSTAVKIRQYQMSGAVCISQEIHTALFLLDNMPSFAHVVNPVSAQCTERITTIETHASDVTKKLTLAEMKNLVPTTKGKVRPTAKFLRENETVIASSDVSDSTMAVYASGFALYKTENHQYVLRLDCIHSAEYERVEDEGPHNTYVPLDELDWDTAVLLDGEQRIEADRLHRLSRTTVSMTGTGVQNDEDEPQDMELDAGVDIAGEYERKEEKAEAVKLLNEILSCLTERQREIVTMYYLHEMTQQGVADALNLPQQYVDRVLKAALKKIQKKF